MQEFSTVALEWTTEDGIRNYAEIMAEGRVCCGKEGFLSLKMCKVNVLKLDNKYQISIHLMLKKSSVFFPFPLSQVLR